MPKELTIALTLIFILTCGMAVRIAWRIIKGGGDKK